jgi:hypothetical protein
VVREQSLQELLPLLLVLQWFTFSSVLYLFGFTLVFIFLFIIDAFDWYSHRQARIVRNNLNEDKKTRENCLEMVGKGDPLLHVQYNSLENENAVQQHLLVHQFKPSYHALHDYWAGLAKIQTCEMQIREKLSEKQGPSGRQIVVNMIHNYHIQNIFSQIMDLHLLLLRCQLLQVYAWTRSLSNVNRLLRTLTLLLPHRLPIVFLYRKLRRQFEELFTSVMQTLEGREEG